MTETLSIHLLCLALPHRSLTYFILLIHSFKSNSLSPRHSSAGCGDGQFVNHCRCIYRRCRSSSLSLSPSLIYLYRRRLQRTEAALPVTAPSSADLKTDSLFLSVRVTDGEEKFFSICFGKQSGASLTFLLTSLARLLSP